MSSFKLESGGNAKSQAKSAGALCLALGLFAGLVIAPAVGGLLMLAGSILLIGGFAASE